MIPVLAPKPPLSTTTAATNIIDTTFKHNFSKSPLKSDHETRPIWVCPNLHLYLETYSPIYKQAYDFLIAISDPVSRPLFIHEYVISQYSLYAAASLGLSTDDIIYGLQRLCKNQVPQEVKLFITKHTQKCGKVKLLLKNQRYYIESPYHHVLTELISGSTDIRYARCDFNLATQEGKLAQQEALLRIEAENNIMNNALLLQDNNIVKTKRAALQTDTTIYYNYDNQTGYIIENIDQNEEALMLPGTGTIDKDGKRTLTKVDQRAAMGLFDGINNGDLFDDDMTSFLDDFGVGIKQELVSSDDDNDDAIWKSLHKSHKTKKTTMDDNDDYDDDVNTLNNNSDDNDDDDDDDDDDDMLDEFLTSESDDDNGNYKTLKNGKKVKKAPKKLSLKAQKEKEAKKQAKMVEKAEKYRLRKLAKKQLKTTLKPTKLYSFEIYPDRVETVRTASNRLGYPMLEEYDFRHDHSIDEYILPMSLKPHAQIREYQEKALSKMFGNGRARSGIIVLPCGAGKTLVGITAMATVNRSCLIVVSTGVAAQQWKQQVKLWTNLPEEYIYVFASGEKVDIKTKPKVIIATYSMLAYEQKRSEDAQKVMDAITSSEWGLLLLDEVHVAPADKFKKCITVTHSRCKLGLTATLVREDDKVISLIEMIGPKLYEASWLDLSRQGFIATVRCYEVWCPMTAEFYKEYLNSPHHLQRLLYVTNPNKFLTLERLMRLHEARGDKIMIFCEDTTAIKFFSQFLDRKALLGETKDVDRLKILHSFSSSPGGDSVLISKIGDNSIDLPDTNVIIQISSHYASRRQEAQRLGRILRPKSHRSGAVDAHFYSLVTQDTDEMRYATKRQRFLVDQGYAYKVLKQEHIFEQTKSLIANFPPSTLNTKAKEINFLEQLLQIHKYGSETRNEMRTAIAAAKVRKGRSDEAYEGESDDEGGRRKRGTKKGRQ